MSFRKTLLAATMLALPLAAQAQPVTGIYVAGAAGANWQGNTNFDISSSGTTYSQRSTSSVGWLALASAGWGFGNGLRLEAEVNYRTNDTDSVRQTVNGAPTTTFRTTGYTSTYGIMGNVLYDIGATQRWPVHLTLGAGLGYAWSRYDNVGGTTGTWTSPASQQATVNLNNTNGGFAWQGIAGLSLPISQVPGLALTLEYRYFQTLSTSMQGTVTSPAYPNQVFRGNDNVSNLNQSVLVGVRYNFGQRPAAPPPPVVRPATSFIVFFDFNRSDLTARAREIVAQAAASARTNQVTRIEVAGHTDTVGSAQYNQGLSQRRANTVAAELVRLGVPRQAIQTAGYGFSRPLVPTGPNVREPQNRRVEITFR